MNRTEPFPDWIKKELPFDIERHFFQSSLGKMHYLSKGAGQKVILLHGNPTWGFLWRRVIRELSSIDYQVIVPDLMNLGFSDYLKNSDFNMSNHVAVFEEFFKFIGVEGSIFVVQDWGGPIGLAALAKLNAKPNGIVLLNTGVMPPKHPFKVSKFHTFVNKKLIPDILFNVCRYPMYTLHGVQYDKSTIRGKIAKAYRFPMKQRSDWTSALKFARMVPNSNAHPSYSLFEEVQDYCRNYLGPVEAIWGTKDPILGRGLKRVEEIFKNIRVKELDAGHFLQEECPIEIVHAIKNLKADNEG